MGTRGRIFRCGFEGIPASNPHETLQLCSSNVFLVCCLNKLIFKHCCQCSLQGIQQNRPPTPHPHHH
jgi:hypothetical protein